MNTRVCAQQMKDLCMDQSTFYSVFLQCGYRENLGYHSVNAEIAQNPVNQN